MSQHFNTTISPIRFFHFYFRKVGNLFRLLSALHPHRPSSTISICWWFVYPAISQRIRSPIGSLRDPLRWKLDIPGPRITYLHQFSLFMAYSRIMSCFEVEFSCIESVALRSEVFCQLRHLWWTSAIFNRVRVLPHTVVSLGELEGFLKFSPKPWQVGRVFESQKRCTRNSLGLVRLERKLFYTISYATTFPGSLNRYRYFQI